jgi:hypothetical protein
MAIAQILTGMTVNREHQSFLSLSGNSRFAALTANGNEGAALILPIIDRQNAASRPPNKLYMGSL